MGFDTLLEELDFTRRQFALSYHLISDTIGSLIGVRRKGRPTPHLGRFR